MKSFFVRNFWVWIWVIFSIQLLFFPNQEDYYTYIQNNPTRISYASAFYHNGPAYSITRLILPIVFGVLLSYQRFIAHHQQKMTGQTPNPYDVLLTKLLLIMAFVSLLVGLMT